MCFIISGDRGHPQAHPTFVQHLVQPRGQLVHEAFPPPDLVPLHIARANHLILIPSSVDLIRISTFETATARNLGVRKVSGRRSRVRRATGTDLLIKCLQNILQNLYTFNKDSSESDSTGRFICCDSCIGLTWILRIPLAGEPLL